MSAVQPLDLSNAIRIPNDWRPTRHQLPLWRDMKPRNGKKRGIAVWHRRAGKDSTAINLACVKAHQEIGTYWHLLPTNVQARRAVWNETDRHHRRIIEQAFPLALRESTNDGDMAIRLKCGSLYQLGGSDNYNSLVGANVRGVIFSEWALCDPSAWDYIRPILLENDGWALFIYTPRGRNHGWDLWERNEHNPRWHASKLDVDSTFREDGSPIITPEMLEQEREDGMSEEMLQQEYFVSFAAGVVGAYFAREVEKARDDGRIGPLTQNRRLGCRAYFDLGLDDYTTCWVQQRQGWQRKWLRYREWKDVALQDVFQEVAAWDYRWAEVHLPHDGGQRDKGTAIPLKQYAEEAFGDNVVVRVHPPYDKQVQIEAGRFLLTQSWIDDTEEGCKRGLDTLLNYSKVWDEKRRTYLLTPLHNWASHGADAWMLAGCDDIDEPVEDVDDYMTKMRGRGGKPRVRRSIGRR